jgi:transcriptional regulator with XRE-family HTH domain
MLVMTRQIRAARSLLGWEQNDLAVRSDVAVSTIRRLEKQTDAGLAANFRTIEKIRHAFETAGIEFLGNPSPGVRVTMEACSSSRLDESQDNVHRTALER